MYEVSYTTDAILKQLELFGFLGSSHADAQGTLEYVIQHGAGVRGIFRRAGGARVRKHRHHREQHRSVLRDVRTGGQEHCGVIGNFASPNFGKVKSPI